LNQPPEGQQHDQRTGDGQQYMAMNVEIAAMESDYVHGQRKIGEHIGKDDGDCTERPGKTEVVQRRDSSKQAKPKDEHM
jgi:hypothetical protein